MTPRLLLLLLMTADPVISPTTGHPRAARLVVPAVIVSSGTQLSQLRMLQINPAGRPTAPAVLPISETVGAAGPHRGCRCCQPCLPQTGKAGGKSIQETASWPAEWRHHPQEIIHLFSRNFICNELFSRGATERGVLGDTVDILGCGMTL